MKQAGEARLIYEGFKDGVWYGLLVGVAKGKRTPELTASLDGVDLKGISIEPYATMSAAWKVVFTLPAQVLQDGSSVVLFSLNGNEVGNFRMQAGPSKKSDLGEEVAQLRAELDMVKRVLRAHLRSS